MIRMADYRKNVNKKDAERKPINFSPFNEFKLTDKSFSECFQMESQEILLL